MARRFRVTIGGISYQVEVEEIGGGQAAAPAAPTYAPPAPPALAAPVAPPAPAAAPAPAPAPAPAVPAAPARREPPAGEGDAVRAPLPGMVVAVRCELGQAVKPGDVLVVLEAMKMENEITATSAGTVKEILVEKGTPVSQGDALVLIG